MRSALKNNTLKKLLPRAVLFFLTQVPDDEDKEATPFFIQEGIVLHYIDKEGPKTVFSITPYESEDGYCVRIVTQTNEYEISTPIPLEDFEVYDLFDLEEWEETINSATRSV